jgi:sugar lactone lactonase YvrE
VIKLTCVVAAVWLVGSIAKASDDRAVLWVAGSCSDNIVRFDLYSGAATVIAKLANGSRPRALALNDRGQIFVGLRGNQKNVVELVASRPAIPDGPLLAVDVTPTIGRFGPGLMAFDKRGLLNVAGDTERVVLRYDVKTHELIESVQTGRQANLVGLTIHDGSLFVAEYFQKSILRVNLDVDASACTPFVDNSDRLDRPHGMAVGHNGNLFVSNLENDLVQEFDTNTGKHLRTFLDVKTFGGSRVNDLHFNRQIGHYFLSSGSTVYELGTDGSLIARFHSSALSDAQGIISRVVQE